MKDIMIEISKPQNIQFTDLSMASVKEKNVKCSTRLAPLDEPQVQSEY